MKYHNNNYLVNIINYLDKNYKCDNTITDIRSKLRYYLTKYSITIPDELSNQLNYILQSEINQNPVLNLQNPNKQLTFIRHDITQIKADAIVNAANSNGLGCFEYNHKCCTVPFVLLRNTNVTRASILCLNFIFALQKQNVKFQNVSVFK